MCLEGDGAQGISSYVGRCEPIEEIRIEFPGCPTAIADQERRLMTFSVTVTGDIGVQALNTMHKAHTLKELEGAIDRWRLGRFTAQPKCGDQIIGLQRAFCLKQEFKHSPSGRGESLPRCLATCLGQT